MFNPGFYIVIGILIAVVLLTLFAAVKPKLKKYRLELKRVEPKKRHSKPAKKKRKSVYLKIL